MILILVFFLLFYKKKNHERRLFLVRVKTITLKIKIFEQKYKKITTHTYLRIHNSYEILHQFHAAN